MLLLSLTSKAIPEKILIYFLKVSLRRFLYISTKLSNRKKAIYKTLFCHCCLVSHVQLFANPWTVALQAPLSMGFPRQEYWSGLSFPSPEDLSSWTRNWTHVSCDAGRFFTTGPLGKPLRARRGNLNSVAWISATL